MAWPPSTSGRATAWNAGSSTQWLVAGVGVALLLFVGRWGAELYTDQLWAGSVSTGASGALRRRALLGLGLDTIATLLATLWWAGNLMVAHRVALRLPTEAPGGNPRFRRLIAAREAHSVLGAHLVDTPDHPTRAAVDAVIRFLEERLR